MNITEPTTRRRRRASVGIAAVAIVVASPGFARAVIPEPIDAEAGPTMSGVVATSSAEEATRPCFIQQPRWNIAADGAVPTCQ